MNPVSIIVIVIIVIIALVTFLVVRGKREDAIISKEWDDIKNEKKRILQEYCEKSKESSDILTVCFPTGRLTYRTEIHCFKDGVELEMRGQDFKQPVYRDKFKLTTIEGNGFRYHGVGNGFKEKRPSVSSLSGSSNSSNASWDSGDYFESNSGSSGGDEGPTLYHNWYADRGAVVEDSYGNTSDYNGRSYSDY